ncbi:hypothetical protein B0O80DRAFT_461662 [Mortierella sp. GBAus27b]|nr:hypothetical protein B0O80DRAFT_461662 [Mortierella sp. GBAus27b]
MEEILWNASPLDGLLVHDATLGRRRYSSLRRDPIFCGLAIGIHINHSLEPFEWWAHCECFVTKCCICLSVSSFAGCQYILGMTVPALHEPERVVDCSPVPLRSMF